MTNVQNWVTWIIAFFSSLVDFLDSWVIFQGVSFLNICLVALLVSMLIGTFIARGRS